MKGIKKIFNFLRREKVRKLIALGFWALFIGVLLVKFAIPYEESVAAEKANKVKEEQTKESAFEDMKKDLLNHMFEYKYIAVVNNQRTTYRGTMFMEETIGIKESSKGLEKYYVNENSVYSMVLEEKTLIPNQTTEVYNNYLSLENIMGLIKDKTYTQNENEYTYEFDGIYVKIVTGVNNITQIEINDNNKDYYLLEFNKVNEITSLAY